MNPNQVAVCAAAPSHRIGKDDVIHPAPFATTTPYDKGHRNGYDKRPKAAHAYTADADLNAYAEGYGDGCQLREDELLEQIVDTYPDGARTISGHRFA